MGGGGGGGGGYIVFFFSNGFIFLSGLVWWVGLH
jgi:hypothetical protein